MDGGRLSISLPLGEASLYVELDTSVLLYTIILLSLVYSFIDAFHVLLSDRPSK